MLSKNIVPLQDNYDSGLNFVDKENLRDIIVEGDHTCKPKFQELEEKLNQKPPISINTIKHNIELLKNSIRKYPFRSANFFYNEMLKSNQKFTKEAIRKYLSEIRNEFYPNDESLVFDEKFCETLDYETSKMSLFQGWFKIPINENSKKNKSTPRSEFVIMSSRSMLNQLHLNKNGLLMQLF